MLIIILTALYYVLPGLIANTIPVLGRKKIMFMAQPVDFGLKFRGRRLLGDNKTFRGFFLGITSAAFIGILQFFLRDITFIKSISYIDYTLGNAVTTAVIFGFAALFGDAIESAIKRQMDYPPGKPLIPFDQMDFIFGILLFSFLFKPMTAPMIISVLIIAPILSLLATRIGYFLKIRKEKW